MMWRRGGGRLNRYRRVFVGDGSGAAINFLHACQKLIVTFISRLRLDAALYDPAPLPILMDLFSRRTYVVEQLVQSPASRSCRARADATPKRDRRSAMRWRSSDGICSKRRSFSRHRVKTATWKNPAHLPCRAPSGALLRYLTVQSRTESVLFNVTTPP